MSVGAIGVGSPPGGPDFAAEIRRAAAGGANLKALRELKNQIIGNRTKKLSYIKLGAVPSVVSILASASADVKATDVDADALLLQSAAAIGSFACGFDDGVKAVIDAGAFPHLLSLISHPNDKVVDAGARSLKMIYQSKLAPKYDFLQDKNVTFLLSLLNSENENVTGLGASIITHSCETSIEQKALSDAGVLKRLICLIGGSLCQRDASLESLVTIIKGNPEVVSKFLGPESGRALTAVTELTKDSQVGDEAAFALSSLIAEKEELQKLAFEENVVDKLCNHLRKGPLQAKRIQGILLALADLCSKLESCRSRLLSLQVLNMVTDALSHDSANVRAAACLCLKSVTRSVKDVIQNLSAGSFMKEVIVIPLVQLLHDTSTSVQVAALGAISNIVVDFTTHKSLFIQCGGVKQLVQLSKSMEPTLRVNAVWALRNLTFLTDNRCKGGIFLELTASALASLIGDPEPSVQEQALALVRNLVDGCWTLNPLYHGIRVRSWVTLEWTKSLPELFLLSSLLPPRVSGLHVQRSVRSRGGANGMYALGNVASGNEFHKEAVLHQLLPQIGDTTQSIIIKHLQNNDSQLRTAAVWALVNLTFPSSPGAHGRVVKLRNAGITSQLKNMVNDPCLDVKLRVRAALGQIMTFGDGST
ncbi:ARM repeat superfamily protein [Actinidia rufa]|uniref:ARM repeat superfamily protein n=1 Tax=Actinidia rufa TaxID=165716 RepID=A0A7J0GQF4_9ERIC|nr:ARM repeat superfamily protein [Actinidia rufa]